MSSFPPPPTESLEWDKLGIAPMNVNAHVECDYSVSTGHWSEPRLVEDPLLRIHGLAPGLNYGQQAFEGMKAYRDPQGQIHVFRPKDHAARLALSCSAIAIPTIPEELFLRSVNLAVARNAEYVPPYDTDAALYIRPLAFGSDAFFAVSAGTGYKFCIYVQPYKAYHGSQPIPALILEDLDRAAPKGVGHVKVGGNYAPVLKWSDQARAEGFFITLHLDSRTNSEIDEFSTSGFLGLKKTGESFTVVVPSSRSILKSVTSTTCLDLARSLGWNVEVRAIPYSELPYFTEVVAVGTAAMLVPIRSITRKSTGETFQFSIDGPGDGCQKLLQTLVDTQKGRVKSNEDWLWQVSPVGEGAGDSNAP
ncbi:putative branched-chain-amino-acid aminotransferase TOXF [Aspergillus udagawae]|uniref:Branched-chain-amino-acid aminotransferase TOXF n=1 Tax=Aspergillus udagawae TaxID=91492 RepID=A0ABQ1AZK0_9EURO|nr:putative branched-chain-amino-acid aminotransferase TOXF [Aspergillus udagawae]GFF89454.1 putative branched-chain-amino-acid aminotransferase TOXF [Aspergillus udagawae]GFG24898.1 putative branched-chain-amino-acid aminotransferase TOXF [Aspergillus udagawae]